VSHKLFAALGYAQKPKFRIEIMPTPADVEPTPDDLLASAIHVIRETWACIRKGPYGKQVLLQTIYQVYDEWSRNQKLQIGRRLLPHPPENRRTKPHVLELVIHAALPNMEPPVVLNWVDAIRLGAACNVQPSNLRAFLYAKGGLVRCAEEFRERQAEEERREEEQRQAEEDERAEKRRRRKAQKAAKRFRGLPALGLYRRSL
jgi:hypothetical protein